MFEEVLVSNVACRLWSLLHNGRPATKENLSAGVLAHYCMIVRRLASDGDFQRLVVMGLMDESQAKGEAAARRLAVEVNWDSEPGQATS